MMRTEDEFKAEVYKRSNIRIKKKRTRRKSIITTISISAAIICCILSVWIISPMHNINNSEPEIVEQNISESMSSNPIEENVTENIMDGMENDFIDNEGLTTNGKLTIVQNNLSNGAEIITNNILDAERINKFVNYINKLESDESSNMEDETIYDNELANVNFIYTFTLVDSTGIEHEYTLRESVLTVWDTSEKYKLNDIQLKSLWEIIQ